MKPKNVLISLAIALLAQVPEAARCGDKVGGGGESVRVGRHSRLRDLVMPSCEQWVLGPSFVSGLPTLELMFEKIEAYRPGFGRNAREDLAKVFFCLVPRGALKRFPIEDEETTVKAICTRQAAVRIDKRVYVDRFEFEKMPEEDRSALVFHELMHTFVSPGKDRMNRLRDFVHMAALLPRESVSKEEFITQMEAMDVHAGWICEFRIAAYCHLYTSGNHHSEIPGARYATDVPSEFSACDVGQTNSFGPTREEAYAKRIGKDRVNVVRLKGRENYFDDFYFYIFESVKRKAKSGSKHWMPYKDYLDFVAPTADTACHLMDARWAVKEARIQIDGKTTILEE